MKSKSGWWVAFCLLLMWLPTSVAAQETSETRVAALVQELKDPREDVRISAANALGKLGPEAKKAVPDLIGVLNDRRETVQVAIVQALHNILPQTTFQLIEALKDEDVQMRSFAAISLARFDQLPKDAIQPLIEAAKDKNPLVRFYAAQALLRTDADQNQTIAIPVFVEALRDRDKNVSSGAARLLASVAERSQDKSKALSTTDLTKSRHYRAAKHSQSC
jgi:HEAT repeat protein